MACLDTDALIHLSGHAGRRSAAAATEIVESLLANGEPLVTTRFNAAELLVGVQMVTNQEKELAKISRLLQPFEILEFDQHAAREFARIFAHLKRKGKPAGDMDTLIAATAMANGHAIVTGNAKHFSNMPGVVVIGY